MRFYEYEARRIVELAGIPVTKYGFCKTRRGGPQGGRGDRRAGGDQVPGAERRPDEGRRRQVRRHAGGGRRARRGDPRARDQRPHAARRPGRPESRGQAGVLRRRRLGRDREAAADAVQRHGRDRHRGGRREPPRPRRPRPRLQPAPDRRLRGQADDRRDRGDRLAADPGDADPRPPRPPLPRQRHDPGRDQPAGRADRRQLRRPRRPHGDGERGGRPPEGTAAQASSEIAEDDTREPYEPSGLRAQRRGDRRRRPPRRDPGQGPRLRGQPRPRDRRRRRLADADRRGPQPGRQARQLLRDRRQPLGRQGLRPGQGGARRRTASRRSR